MSTSRLSTRSTRPSRFATQLSPSPSASASASAQAAAGAVSTSNQTSNNTNSLTNPRTVNDQVSLMAARTAAGRATHRVTVRKTAQQVARLQEMWAQTTTPTKEQREQIAEEIGLDTRIVSTWFRDERSKLTRMRAEQERGSGPIRNTRTGLGHKQRPSAASISASVRSDSVALDDMLSDEEPTFDSSYQPPATSGHTHAAQPQPQPRPGQAQAHSQAPVPVPVPVPMSNHGHSHSHSQEIRLTVTDPYEQTTRYSPYRGPQRLIHSPITKASDRHDRFDSQPVIRRSAPIDIYRHQHQDERRLPMETDQESSYYLSPGREYQRLSVPAPSPMSDTNSDSSSSSEDEDEYEEGEEEEDARETSAPLLRTPSHLPSSLPSPRVIHASSSSPTRGPITLNSFTNTDSSGTHTHSHSYTFEPLPSLSSILGPQLANPDSSWRWNYYDKVSSLRKTLENTLYHNDKGNSNSNADEHEHEDDESDAYPSPGPSPRGFGVVDLDENSPRMRTTKMETGVLDRFDRLGLFQRGVGAGGAGVSPKGRKQFFVTPTAYDPTKMA